MNLSVGKQTKLQGLFRSSYGSSKPKGMLRLLRLMDFHGALQEAPHQRLFANARHTNVCV